MSDSEKIRPRSALLLKDAKVLDYLPIDMDAEPAPRVETVDLRIEDGRIVERGTGLEPRTDEQVVAVDGRTVMPGHVNAHHHLYSTLAPGMPAPAETPRNFQEVLTEIWWKLDRALDADAIYMSAVAGAWDAMRCGTTLIVDHHSSVTSVGDSLDHIERGIADVGLRGCLCYEVTDRGGPGSRDTMLAESRRYLEKVAGGALPAFRGLVGAHASFTLEDRTLELLAELCDAFDVGVHIHLAEGTTDREICNDRGWPDPLERLDSFGLIRPGAVLAHGVDLTPLDLQVIEEKGAWLVHNGRSNMNNGVGRAPVDRFPSRVCLGTDGLDGNMWGEIRTTFYRGNETGRGPLGFSGAERFWFGGYRLAREIFGEPFGSLDAGAPADFLICEAHQRTPLETDNWLGMMLFGFHPWDIAEVYVSGERRYRRGDPAPYDGQACRDAARRIWDRMKRL
ncbi:amidohydrolase family protein [bacterium]|nr:amidohydrolase family protein [bacterium]